MATWLSSLGHDAVHAIGVGLARARDVQILARAENEGRTVITADLDYPRLLAISGADAPSLILFRDGNWSEADIVARMKVLLRSLTADDIERSMIVVERDRVRRRRLPLTRP